MKRFLQKMFSRPMALLRRDMKRWYNGEGSAYLKKVGISYGFTVVDFGARVGHYAIPAAEVVGVEGYVVAIDKDAKSLEKLAAKAAGAGLGNITTVATNGKLKIDMEADSVDCVLFYDILHMFQSGERRLLYDEARKVSKKQGLLSIHAAHCDGFLPNKHFAGKNPDDIRDEIMAAGWVYRNRVGGRISHDNGLVESSTLNFTKEECE